MLVIVLLTKDPSDGRKSGTREREREKKQNKDRRLMFLCPSVLFHTESGGMRYQCCRAAVRLFSRFRSQLHVGPVPLVVLIASCALEKSVVTVSADTMQRRPPRGATSKRFTTSPNASNCVVSLYASQRFSLPGFVSLRTKQHSGPRGRWANPAVACLGWEPLAKCARGRLAARSLARCSNMG